MMQRYRAILFSALLGLSLLPQPVARAAGETATARVIARGPFAGTRIYVSPDGLVRPAENLESGAAGRIGSRDGGRTWIYQDTGGGSEEVVELDALPTHLHHLSAVVSRLRALGRRGRVVTADDLAQPALQELAEVREAWLAQGGATLRKTEVQQALRELDGVIRTLQHAASGTDEEVADAYQDVLPRLHAVTALALRQPRQGVTVTVRQTVIDFGIVPVGTSTPAGIGLSTNSTTEVTVAADVTGLAAPFSSAGGNVSVLKASGGSLQITFAPAAAGDFQGQVVFTHPGLPGGRVTVQVKGSARAEKLVVQPNPLDFGKIPVHSSKTLVFSVTNNTLQAAEIESQFTTPTPIPLPTGDLIPIQKPFSTGPPRDVNGKFQPRETGTVYISFSPKQPGKYEAQATVTSSQAPGVLITVPIIGEAIAPVSVAPSPINFGTVKVGTSATQPFTVTNNTDQPLPISFKAPHAPFQLGTVTTMLPANGTMTVNVSFSPTEERTYSDKVEISGGVKGLKFKVEVGLQGVGKKTPLTGLALSKENVAFGVVPKRTQGTQTLTLTNTGQAAKAVTLDTSGLHAEFFNVLGGNSFTLQPGGTHTVTITFGATGVCTHKGKIVVQSDGGAAEVPVSASSR